jgi:hypothetical protein
MGRFPWERYGGDDIEAAVAIMLLRENTAAQRIRPSQGDGGVDILVPLSGNQWEVYQVKGFTKRLDSSQKSQIRKSWKRLLKFTAARGISVSAWHVVRPLDPTHPDREWLDALTGDSGVPCDWIGLSTLEGWAARYRDVMDYMFADGQARVHEMLRELLSAASMSRAFDAGELTTPAESAAGLESLYKALNRSDPHYRYEVPPGCGER